MFKNIFTCLIFLFFVVINAYTQNQSQNPDVIYTTIETLTNLQAAGIVEFNEGAGLEQSLDSAAYLIIKVKFSADGNAIVNEQGKEIVRFKEGKEFKSGEKEKLFIPGCLCCTWECVAYDSQGHCIQLIRSCTWDFDCSCK